MSAAIKAKSAKARATIAIRLAKTIKGLSNCRGFDDCFEMGDGDAVVAEIVRRAAIDPAIRALFEGRGFGYWFEPGYLEASK